MKRLALLGLSCLLVVAHADSPDSMGGSAANAESTMIIPFNIIDNGTQSGMHPDAQTLLVIEDKSDWLDFWAKHNTIKPAPKPPVVDFDENMVVAVIDSDQPNSGYYLSLDKIEKHDDELWVYITREQPAPSCMNLGMVSQPFVFATAPYTDGEPKLVFSTHMYNC